MGWTFPLGLPTQQKKGDQARFGCETDFNRNYRYDETNNPSREGVKRLETVFFEVSDDKFAIAALVFEGLLTLALFFGFFLALYTQPGEG